MNAISAIKTQAGLMLLLTGVALALPAAAAAEETKVLYKCVDPQGVVSIQAASCPKGSTEAWKRDAQTEPKQTQEQLAEAQAREARNRQQVRELSEEVQQKLLAQQRANQPPAATAAAPADAPAAPTPAGHISQCEVAQNFAAEVREKTWLSVTEEQSKRIYGWVADQCRVNTKPSE